MRAEHAYFLQHLENRYRAFRNWPDHARQEVKEAAFLPLALQVH